MKAKNPNLLQACPVNLMKMVCDHKKKKDYPEGMEYTWNKSKFFLPLSFICLIKDWQ